MSEELTVVQKMESRLTELNALQTKCSEQEQRIAALDAKIAEMLEASAKSASALENAEKALADEQNAHAVSRTELDAVKAVLANPAFADAAVIGSGSAVEEGSNSEAMESLSPQDLYKEYCSITDAVVRAEFRKNHPEILGI